VELIKHLVGVLNSQVALYTEFCAILGDEKRAIIEWAVDRTVEITKRKESLLKREVIQKEAQGELLRQIALLIGKSTATVADAIKYAKDTPAEMELVSLCERLVELITRIKADNLSLRMLYATNSRMINDFFKCAGLVENTYNPTIQPKGKNFSTIREIG
jgi:hypothetical protein